MKRKFWGIKPTAGVLFAFASSIFLTNYVQAQQTVAAKTENVAQQQLRIVDAKKLMRQPSRLHSRTNKSFTGFLRRQYLPIIPGQQWKRNA